MQRRAGTGGARCSAEFRFWYSICGAELGCGMDAMPNPAGALVARSRSGLTRAPAARNFCRSAAHAHTKGLTM